MAMSLPVGKVGDSRFFTSDFTPRIIQFLDPKTILSLLLVNQECSQCVPKNVKAVLQSSLGDFIGNLIGFLGENAPQVQQQLREIASSLPRESSRFVEPAACNLILLKTSFIASIKSRIIAALAGIHYQDVKQSLHPKLTPEKVPFPFFCKDILQIDFRMRCAVHPSPDRATLFSKLVKYLIESDQRMVMIQFLNIAFDRAADRICHREPSLDRSLINMSPEALIQKDEAGVSSILLLCRQIIVDLDDQPESVLLDFLRLEHQGAYPLHRRIKRGLLFQSLGLNNQERVLLLINKATYPQRVRLVAFMIAVENGNLDLVQALLKISQVTDANKVVALQIAARKKYEELCLFLLDHIQGSIALEDKQQLLCTGVKGLLVRFVAAFLRKHPIDAEGFRKAKIDLFCLPETENTVKIKKQIFCEMRNYHEISFYFKSELEQLIHESIKERNSPKIQSLLNEISELEETKENNNFRLSKFLEEILSRLEDSAEVQFLLENMRQRRDFHTVYLPKVWEVCDGLDKVTDADSKRLAILRWITEQPDTEEYIVKMYCYPGDPLFQRLPRYVELKTWMSNFESLDPLSLQQHSPNDVGIALVFAASKDLQKEVDILLQDPRIPQNYLNLALGKAKTVKILQVLLPNRSFSEDALSSALQALYQDASNITSDLLELFLEAGPISGDDLDYFFMALVPTGDNEEGNLALFYHFLNQRKENAFTGVLKKHKTKINNSLIDSIYELINSILKKDTQIALSELRDLYHRYDIPIEVFVETTFAYQEINKFFLSEIKQIDESQYTKWLLYTLKNYSKSEYNICIPQLMQAYQRCLQNENPSERGVSSGEQEERAPKRIRIEASDGISQEVFGDMLKVLFQKKNLEVLDFFAF